MEITLEGSALYKENPRDWDLRMYVPDIMFEWEYCLTAQKFVTEGRSGQWSESRWRWANDCVRIARLLANISGKNVDFRLLPESLRGTGA
jgi:hypothetical protein